MTTAAKLFAAALLMATAGQALAQSEADAWPTRPIRVVVPYAAGGADAYIRPLTTALEQKHKITLIIESVTGAGGAIGTSQVKRAAPDGYTILFCGTGALTIVPKVNRVDYTMADFEPVLNLVSVPFVLAARKQMPYKTFKDMVAYAKAGSTPITYGSPGVGSSPYFAMEAVAENLKMPIQHVPFSGIVPAVTAIAGGHIDAVIGVPNIVMPQVRNGNLVALAMTSRERFKLEPDIPTFAEQGADINVVTSFGFVAPKGTPQPIIKKLAAAIRDAATDAGFVKAMETMQMGITLLPSEEFAKVLNEEANYFGPIIEKISAKK